jgi:hypothetical protein
LIRTGLLVVAAKLTCGNFSHPYRFAFFFLFTTLLAAFFFPDAFRPADNLVCFADLLEEFLALLLAFFTAFFAVFFAVFFGDFAALATFFAAFLTDVGMRLATAFFARLATDFTAASAS